MTMLIGTRWALLGGKALIKYLLRATFDAPNQGYADGQVLDTTAEGIQDGQLTVTEVDGTLAIVGNKCALTAQATPNWGDLGFYSQAIARALGRGLLVTVNSADTNKYILPVFYSNQARISKFLQFATDCEAAIRLQGAPTAGQIRARILHKETHVGTYAAATDYATCIVLGGYDTNGVPWRSGQAASSYLYGAAYYIKGGTFTNWTLLWRGSMQNTATLYAVGQSYNAAGTFDDFRVPNRDLSAVLQPNNLSLFAVAGELSAYTPELGGAWTEDIGDWDTAGGVLQATALGIATFTGLADCIYDTKITTAGAGTTAGGLVLRETNLTGGSEDYWYVKVTPGTAGVDWELIEYVGGGATQRASGDVDWAVATAYNVRAICDGQTISCFADGGDKITYGSAVSGEAAASFGLRDEGNANMTFDNDVLFARTSNVYNRELDRV